VDLDEPFFTSATAAALVINVRERKIDALVLEKTPTVSIEGNV
jgi:hypothetical protein